MLIFPPSVSAKFSNSVFHLDYDQQGFSLDNDIHEVVCALRAFASCLPVEWKEGGNLSPELLAVVQTKLGQCYSEIVWKPTFGCAICLIAEKSGSVHMQVIGLDTWKNIMRRSGGGEPAAFVSTAESNAYKPIPCGQVPQANVQDVLHGLEQEIQARIAKTKDKKNLHGSTSDNSGIQYTPGFAATLLNKVIASISGGTAFAFQGGFTDVGLHTDCFVRDTAWKLVCFVLEELIASQEYKTVSRQDTKRFLHLFQLSVAVDYSTKPFAVNDTFDMLSKLERDTENCVNLAQDVAADFVAEQCRQIRLALDKCVKVQCETVQQEHQLVPGTLCDNLKSPHMGITELESQPSGISDFEALAITELIELPLNWLVGLRGFQPSQVSDMLHYAQSLEGKTKPVCLPVLLAELENCFQRIADEYLSGGTSNNKALPKVSLGDLDALAQLYRTQLNVFVSQAKGNIHALDVDFQSRETLVVWSVYCTVHKTCWKESPILQKFSVSLKPTDLAHLNVTDVGFQKLLKILHAYLAQPHFAGLSPIFANDDEVTMQFAESYALGNSAMMAEWQNFERKSNAAIDAHWDVIKSAKYRIERLESDVAALEQERISTETSRNARGQSLSGREYSNHSAVTTNLIYDIQCRINKKNNEIWDIDYSPPDTVTMCLPSTKERAMPVLFFLFMPAELRLLSRNSFLAQQMLVCKGMAQEVAVQALKSNWKDFVSGTSVSMSNTSEGDLKFASNLGLDLNMNHHRPSTIRGHITKANGIWYPNNFSHQVEWTGGRDAVLDSLRGGQPFNPFKVTSVSTTTRYTQVLPVRELQWTMSLDAVGGVAAHRGNIALAAPDQRPESLTREQYKAFASLRSQPLLQYQELCCKLCDSTLPFDDPSVHSLVKQLLGHAGPVVNGEFEWRTGAEVKDEFQTVFLDLKAKADTLKESPANLAKVLLFGQIASYYSQFHNGCGVLAREFAGFVETWGHELEKEAELVMDKPVALGDVRFRQASMFGTSLVFYRYLPNLEPTDVENMCRLFVLFANNSPFAAGKMQLGLIASLEFAVREVMAHQRVAVQETINQELSIASRVVGAVDKSFPKDGSVEWQRWKSAAGVFASEDSRYHVDLLFTGKVLVNGRPLTGLPSIIRNHNLFIKTFGTRDFKVLTMENGASKTTFPIDGFFYSFESIGNRLLIKESNETECQTLLDGEACQELTDLPPRLLGLNSLWRCNKFSKGFDETVSVFRGISFSNRSVQFVQVGDNVFEVPAFRCNEPWLELAQASESNLRRLVCGSDAVTKALSNFESEAFIHVFVAPQGDRDGFAQGSIVYNLPRYKMDFVSLAGEPGVLPRSETWKDGCWRLHSTQCLGDTLLGLTRCVVLRSQEGKFKVIVPDGVVRRGSLIKVEVAVPSGMGEKLKYFSYDRHERDGHLVARTLPARLQLAALYSVCTFGLDISSGRFGFEIAVELLRQCFPMKMNKQDLVQLNNISFLGKQKCPAIHLLCAFIAKWHFGLMFLSPLGDQQKSDFPQLFPDQGAVAFYHQETSRFVGGANPRAPLLFGYEHREFFRFALLDGVAPPVTTLMDRLSVNSPELDTFVEDADNEFFNLLGNNTLSGSVFPMKLGLKAQPFVNRIYNELEKSFDAYACMPVKTVDVGQAHQVATERLRQTCLKKGKLESWLVTALWDFIPPHPNQLHVRRLCQATGTARPPTWRDFLRLAFVEGFARELNPFLSRHACDQVVQVDREFLKLCVLEDKLKRILRLGMGSEMLLVKELECVRVWDTNKFPTWLVFEAEQGLQIRPNQARVAESILERPGEILQLQVGEGKTRVILPLIVLASFSGGDAKKMVRLNFLSGLHSEATAYLANTLSASVLARPVFTLPFCREVEFAGKVGMLESLVDLIRDSSGFLSICPQHTMSMSLKLEETSLGNAEFGAFLKRLNSEFIDLFDESDEHMHPRVQLVYAVGDKIALPFGPTRWKAVQRLFLCLRKPALQELLGDEELVTSLDPPPSSDWEPYRAVQLRSVTEGDANYDALKKKQRHLTEVLADHAFREIRWTGKLSLDKYNELLNAIVCLEVDANEVMDSIGLEQEEFRMDVLALRGLLAQGLFLFCLTRRPRVDFGIRRPFVPGVNKRVAVPFRANNTPAPRAEYSQPECSLVWTHMAYYNDGLSEDELKDALKLLLKKGHSERKAEFGQWLEFFPSCKVKEADEIDLSNQAQFQYLVGTFSLNMAVIHFWLSHLTLPQDTTQFPSELVRNAWHLAGSGSCRGISGTNFNHVLLPMQVKQVFDLPDAPDLAATNGKMLCLLMETASEVKDAFPNSLVRGEVKWQQLVGQWLESGCATLIDAGALVTGVSNAQVAEHAVSQLEEAHRWRGVVYFCTDNEDWYMNERNGQCVPLASSSVKTNEALVYFDDCRCRGADLKLRPDAVGMLTLSMGMNLSKLIQAAGRLRQLGHSQTVRLVAPQRVISAMGGSSVMHVLHFAFANMVSEITTNVPQWAARGLAYHRGQTKRKSDVLLDTYAAPSEMVGLDQLIDRLPTAGDSAESQAIVECAKRLGEGFVAKRSKIGGAEEECERETEQEQEEEEELEREVPSAEPQSETDWGVTELLLRTSASEAKAQGAHIGRLSSQLAKSELLSKKAESIPWPAELYCSDNFIQGVVTCPQRDLYVRSAENVVVFPDGSVVLVSEREANALCGASWSASHVTLLRISFCREKLKARPRLVMGRALEASQIKNLDRAFAYIQLFNGDPNYTDERIAILSPMLLEHGQGIDCIVGSVRNRTSECFGSLLWNKREELGEEKVLTGLF